MTSRFPSKSVFRQKGIVKKPVRRMVSFNRREQTLWGKTVMSADARLTRTVQDVIDPATAAYKHYGFSDTSLFVNGSATTTIQGGSDMDMFESFRIKFVEMWIQPNATELNYGTVATTTYHSAIIFDTLTAPTLALIQQYESYQPGRIDGVDKRTFKPRPKLTVSGGSGAIVPMSGSEQDIWLPTGDNIANYGVGVGIESSSANATITVIFKIHYECRSSR